MKQIIIILLIIFLTENMCPSNAPIAINTVNFNHNRNHFIGCIPQQRIIVNCQSYQFQGQLFNDFSVLVQNQCQQQCQQDESSRNSTNLKCLKCRFGFDLDYQFNQCVPSVQFCSNVTSLGLCIQCIPEYVLIGQACFSIPKNCLVVNPQTTLCIVCKSGFQFVEGTCLKIVTCSQGQYLNKSRECQNGTVQYCGKYSNEGICLFCKQNYKFKSDLSKCQDATELKCPPNTAQLKYAAIEGSCVAFDINCDDTTLRRTGCISCITGYYKFRNKCYKI